MISNTDIMPTYKDTKDIEFDSCLSYKLFLFTLEKMSFCDMTWEGAALASTSSMTDLLLSSLYQSLECSVPGARDYFKYEVTSSSTLHNNITLIPSRFSAARHSPSCYATVR